MRRATKPSKRSQSPETISAINAHEMWPAIESKAQVIAQALGGRVARIVEVQEEGFQRPQPIYQGEFAMARAQPAATPIEVGSLDVHSRVQLVAEIDLNP